MHVTSDYYRSHAYPTSAEPMGLAERWSRAVRNAAEALEQHSNRAGGHDASETAPLAPSRQTLQGFARHYHTQHDIRHSG